MNAKEKYLAVERLHVPEWQTDQIQSANFDFVEFMRWLLASESRFNEIFKVERKEIEHLRANQASLRSLLRTPFLMVAPTLTTVEDWRCFVEDTPTTLAVDRLRNMLPPVEGIELFAIRNHNHRFMTLASNLIHTSVLAAPLLGITPAVAEYLGTLRSSQIRMALQRIGGLPLFRWRFTSTTFWYEFTADTLTDEAVAHQIMLTAPLEATKATRILGFSELRMERWQKETFASAMMAHGLRASTASDVFTLNPNKMRARFVEIHGKSSPCGNRAMSLTWFVETAPQRLHATMYIWLYRKAIAHGASAAEALIATHDIYSRLFGGTPLISADRAYNLTSAMAADTRLTTAPCRSCSTHYVVSNSDVRVEMHHSFTCPACAQELGPRRKRVRKNKGAT
ncbi:FlhC family transcriptional regulator [Paraburkholderia sp. BCC1876]|uniref:FlhC family transcriptional regulator n=1 Tax=Paraburkholderia sp. BCC1876 TaxID=2676303 RepID=UPI00159200E4|nr:FlhC family transcriptional regulator [Paraburkholderia sp. BCC1876]